MFFCPLACAAPLAEIKLPLWVVEERKRKVPPVHPPCDLPYAVHVFTAPEKVTGMLQSGQAGLWKIHLIADPKQLVLLVADLHHNGITQVCLDPDPDGTNGKVVPIFDLMQYSMNRQGGNKKGRHPKSAKEASAKLMDTNHRFHSQEACGSVN